jgi:hypothetical protein
VTTDDGRGDYLAGDTGASLDPDDQADLDVVRGLLADPSVWVEPNASLEDSIVTAIAAEASKGRNGNSISPMPAPNGRASEKDRFWLSGRILYGAVGAAAAVVLAVAVAVGMVTGGSHPRRISAALSATALVPRASGAATFTSTTSGWRIELRTTGLPRLDDGRYYEAWMKNSAGVLVAIGTFNEGPEVDLWSGVSPTEFPTITVTEQEANGNPASSGRRVLTGSTAHR